LVVADCFPLARGFARVLRQKWKMLGQTWYISDVKFVCVCVPVVFREDGWCDRSTIVIDAVMR
jgi:hypothetical protein